MARPPMSTLPSKAPLTSSAKSVENPSDQTSADASRPSLSLHVIRSSSSSMQRRNNAQKLFTATPRRDPA